MEILVLFARQYVDVDCMPGRCFVICQNECIDFGYCHRLLDVDICQLFDSRATGGTNPIILDAFELVSRLFKFQIPFPDENTLVQNATHHVNGTYAGLANIATTLNENLFEHYGPDYSSGGREVTFAVVFGVLFSGVTGK